MTLLSVDKRFGWRNEQKAALHRFKRAQTSLVRVSVLSPLAHPSLHPSEAIRSELQEVGAVAARQLEAGREVLGEVRGTGDGSEQRLVDRLLVASLGGGEGLLFPLALLLEESLLLSTLVPGLLLLGEVRVVELVVKLQDVSSDHRSLGQIRFEAHRDARDIDLGLRGDNVRLVDPSERDAVELVGATDEEEAAIELLQEDGPTTAVPSGKEDDNRAGGQGRTKVRFADGLARSARDGSVFGGVELRRLRKRDLALAAVLGTANLCKVTTLSAKLASPYRL